MLNKTFNEYESILKEKVKFFKNFISSGKFLSGKFKLHGYLTINQLDVAIDLYELDYHINNDYYVYGELIQRVEYSAFVPYYEDIKLHDKVLKIWDHIDDEIWNHVNFTIEKKGLSLENINEFIYVDFINIIAYIAYKELALGKEISKQDSEFLEKQIEVYQNGGFPCGWQGEYPEGKMIVFLPK